MSWTDERVEVLKSMWADGNSASEIAKKLGGVTRNAVIGKVFRLGMSNRVATDKPTADKPTADKPAAQKPNKAEAAKARSAPKPTDDKKSSTKPPERPVNVPVRRAIIPANQPLPPQRSNSEVSEEALANVAEAEKSAKKLTLMQLTEKTCKWPIGDPATEKFWFCGLGVQQGKPYCEVHNSVAFQPVTARRDRRIR